MVGAMEMRREIWGGERPTSRSWAMQGVRVMSTLEQRTLGYLEIAAATSALETPIPARKARTASGLSGDLRLGRYLEALRACSGVRPQLVVR